MRRLALVLLALLLAGCAENLPGMGNEWVLSGSFTRSATQEQMDAFARELRETHGASDVLFMESFPVQFQVRGLSESTCPDARAFALEQPYVGSAGDCRLATTSADPDAPTSDGR